MKTVKLNNAAEMPILGFGINRKCTIALALFACMLFVGNNQLKAQNMNDSSVSSGNNKVRLSIITVDPIRLNEYNTFLKEEIEASMRLEPGVLVLYAVSEKGNPTKITILEMYADEAAYQSHLKTPHFIKYKQGTLDMVQELELIDVNPLIPGLKIK